MDFYEMLSPVIVLVITVVAGFLTRLIHKKTENETLGGMLGRLNEMVWDEVKAAEQCAVKAIKAAKDPASEGGVKITEAEGKEIKRKVVDNVKLLWGPSGLKKLGKVLGLDASGLTGLIEGKVEAAVLELSSSVNP